MSAGGAHGMLESTSEADTISVEDLPAWLTTAAGPTLLVLDS